MLEEILELSFVKRIQKKHVSNFTSARGDLLTYIKRLTPTGEFKISQLDKNQESRPRRKRIRRAQSENTGTNWGPERARNPAPSWPRPSPSGWARQKPKPFSQQMRRPFGSDWQRPFSNRGPENSISNSRGGGSFFSSSVGSRNSVSRGFRSNARDSNARRMNSLRPTGALRFNSVRTRGGRQTRSKSAVYSRCEL